LVFKKRKRNNRKKASFNEGKKDAMRPRVAGGGFAASVSSLALASFLNARRERQRKMETGISPD
jgi:hypothetical protein